MNSIFANIPTDFRLLVVISSILLITVAVNWTLNRAISRVAKAKIAKDSFDPTALRFVQRVINTTIYIVGIGSALTHIPEFKIIGHSFLAGAGILTIVSGLASQQILSNIFSGFMIIYFRPFKIGDKITFNNQYTGIVEDITLRETVVRDYENNRVIIPNSQIGSQVIVNANHTDNFICKMIDVGIGYSSDIERAIPIMAETIASHPFTIDNRSSEQKSENVPIVVVRVTNLGDSSVNLRAWAWAENPANGFVLQCDSLQNIKQRFDNVGIEIAFPQTTISFAQNSQLNTSVIRDDTLNAPENI